MRAILERQKELKVVPKFLRNGARVAALAISNLSAKI